MAASRRREGAGAGAGEGAPCHLNMIYLFEIVEILGI